MAQTTRFTSSAVGLMQIINYFDKEFIMSKENEFKIWISAANLPTRSPSIYGLAGFAKSKGLNVKLILSNHEYSFENSSENTQEPYQKGRGYRTEFRDDEIANAKFSSYIHQRSARESGVEERDFEFEEVKSLLREGKCILLRLNRQVLFGHRPEASYYAVIGYDEENSVFKVFDPKNEEMDVPEDQMREAFETLKSVCNRDNRMIVVWK